MRRLLILLILLAVGAYGAYEARRLVEGPELRIVSPASGSATSSVAVTIEGEAHNISFLTINDAPAYTDEAGKFVYRFSPPAGYTTVTVAATDRFGRRAAKSISINVLSYCRA